MSVIFKNSQAYFISHNNYLKETYNKIVENDKYTSYTAREELFKIEFPYAKVTQNGKKSNRKRKLEGDGTNEELSQEIIHVKNIYEEFKKNLIDKQIITERNDEGSNNKALEFADDVYKITGKCNFTNLIGENTRTEAITVEINKNKFLFPENSKFFCCDVNDIKDKLNTERYDLVLLDPPWWNKYIRRKRMKTNDSYNMMYNNDLKNIPIENLISDDGLVVIWCTNAKSHLTTLVGEIFSKWRLKLVATWFWLKVTCHGEPVCRFSEPPGKQPFEQILFASKNPEKYINIKDKIIIVSVPSAVHSHKPPLNDILKEFLPKNPKCLEIFARYLQPNWTSYGLEAIKLQHEALYKKTSA